MIYFYIFLCIIICVLFTITFRLLYKLYFYKEDIIVECINIKTHDKRREDLIQHMKNINFYPKNMKFFDAVTPDTIDILDVPKMDIKRTRLACWLSHINIWKKYKYESKPILIIEDDIRFTDNFQKSLNQILAKLRTIEWDMCFLGRVELENNCPNEILNTCDLERIKNPFHQTHCYLINTNKIIKLLTLCEPKYIKTQRNCDDLAIDVYLSDLNKEDKIKILGVKNQLANQVSSDEYGSSTM